MDKAGNSHYHDLLSCSPLYSIYGHFHPKKTKMATSVMPSLRLQNSSSQTNGWRQSAFCRGFLSKQIRGIRMMSDAASPVLQGKACVFSLMWASREIIRKLLKIILRKPSFHVTPELMFDRRLFKTNSSDPWQVHPSLFESCMCVWPVGKECFYPLRSFTSVFFPPSSISCLASNHILSCEPLGLLKHCFYLYYKTFLWLSVIK